MGRLPDEVERDVGEGDVFLEHRAVAAPFRQAMPQHQAVVAQSEEILEEVPWSAAPPSATPTLEDPDAARGPIELRVAIRLVVGGVEEGAALARARRDDRRARHDPEAHHLPRRA